MKLREKESQSCALLLWWLAVWENHVYLFL